MLDKIVGFFTEALDTGIGFAYCMHTLDNSQRQATIECCEFLAYTGLILWFIDEGVHDILHVIPQPKF